MVPKRGGSVMLQTKPGRGCGDMEGEWEWKAIPGYVGSHLTQLFKFLTPENVVKKLFQNNDSFTLFLEQKWQDSH